MKNIFFKLYLKTLLLTILINFVESANEGYRFKLDIGNPNNYCPAPNYQCSNGLHFVCEDTLKPNSRCVNYKDVEMTKKYIKSFVEGTNGIRNKVANDLGLANMNLVYWSNELMGMAKSYLRQCLQDFEKCLIIGEKHIPVMQNVVIYPNDINDRFPGRIIRHWYAEFGDTKTWRQYKIKHLKGGPEGMANLTRMIYPMMEFMGCSTARMFKGYFVVCYYTPPYKPTTFPTNFTFGKPCTKCSSDRKTCSKTFAGLCGIDFELSRGSLKMLNIILIVIGFMVLLFV